MKDILSIKSEEDYKEAVRLYLKLCCAPEGSIEWAEAELLKIFIEEYEENESEEGKPQGHISEGSC